MDKSVRKILFVHSGDNWIRGSERVLLELIGGLDRKRFEPRLWCNHEAMEKEARACGFAVERSDFGRLSRRNFASALAAYTATVRRGLEIVRREGIDLIHGNAGSPAQFLVPVSRMSRIPLVEHLHSPYLRRDRYRLGLHHVNCLAAVSPLVAEAFRGDGMPADRIVVIPNAVEPRRLPATGESWRRQLGIPAETLVIASVGYLVPQKGYDLLMHALAKMPDLGRPWIALIAGEGPEKENHERLAAELGLSERVRFLGHINPRPLYETDADVFVSSSRSEGFALAMMEAAYFGCAVVATDVGMAPDLIIDGVNGMLVPKNDPAALSKTLERVLGDDALRKSCAARLRNLMRQEYTAEFLLQRFQDLYDRLLTLPPRRLGWTAAWPGLSVYTSMFSRRTA